MNIAEAAKYLFVNRPHVRKLVERCVLAGKSTKHRSKNMRRPGSALPKGGLTHKLKITTRLVCRVRRTLSAYS